MDAASGARPDKDTAVGGSRPPFGNPKDRTYGLRHSDADRFGRLMMAAAGNRTQVVGLTMWRHVKDRSWQGGAARITQEQVAAAFGVSERTVKRWFKVAQALGLIKQDGWTVTKSAYARVGKWVALDLPEALPTIQGCPLNEGTRNEFNPVTTGGQASSSGVEPHRSDTPLSPHEAPTHTSGMGGDSGEAAQQGRDHDGEMSEPKAGEYLHQEPKEALRVALPKPVASLLTETSVVRANGHLDIEFEHSAHRELIERRSNLEVVAAATRKVFGDHVRLVLKDKPKVAKVLEEVA